MNLSRWVMGDVRQYDWAQCRFCGRAQSHDCPPATCMLCSTVQCHGNGATCKVCHYGYIPGWSRPTYDENHCGYKACSESAVTKAPRVGRVCMKHAKTTKLRLARGRLLTIAEYAAEQLAHRDNGKGWEHWRFIVVEAVRSA